MIKNHAISFLLEALLFVNCLVSQIRQIENPRTFAATRLPVEKKPPAFEVTVPEQLMNGIRFFVSHRFFNVRLPNFSRRK